MNAMSHLGVRIRDIFRSQPVIDRLPAFSAVIGAKRAGGRDGDEDSLRIARIEKNGMQGNPARSRLPARPGVAAAKSWQFLPCLPAVGRAEQCGILDPGVDRVRFGARWLASA